MSSSRHPAARFDLQGHRGARGLLPENSLPAFRRALEIGVSTLEMDVVVSADSKVVVSHEPWFSDEICFQPDGTPIPDGEGKRHRIYEMTYEEVGRYDCGRAHPDFPRQESVPARKPLLEEVIEMAEAFERQSGLPPIEYNIETKCSPAGDGELHPPPGEFTRLLHDVLQGKGVVERTTVQSFDHRTLRAARRLDPDLRLSLLVSRLSDRGIIANLDALGFVPDIYSPDFRLVLTGTIMQARARNMKVLPWTVNAERDMRAMLEVGVEGFITDYPDIAVRVIAEYLELADRAGGPNG